MPLILEDLNSLIIYEGHGYIIKHVLIGQRTGSSEHSSYPHLPPLKHVAFPTLDFQLFTYAANPHLFRLGYKALIEE